MVIVSALMEEGCNMDLEAGNLSVLLLTSGERTRESFLRRRVATHLVQSQGTVGFRRLGEGVYRNVIVGSCL